MRMMAAVALVGVVTATGSAFMAKASSDAAWAAFDGKVARACVAASGVPRARTSGIVGFDDRVGMVALLVTGRGGTPPRLCLYDKRTGRARTDLAEGWSAPMAGR